MEGSQQAHFTDLSPSGVYQSARVSPEQEQT